MCICRLDKNTNFAVIFEDIKKIKDQIESLTSSDQDQDTRLDSLATATANATATATGTWCAYQDGPVSTTGTIGYDRLTVSDTNMEVTGTPLSYNTGKYSHTCY